MAELKVHPFYVYQKFFAKFKERQKGIVPNDEGAGLTQK
jgi:hypothetical protein